MCVQRTIAFLVLSATACSPVDQGADASSADTLAAGPGPGSVAHGLHPQNPQMMPSESSPEALVQSLSTPSQLRAARVLRVLHEVSRKDQERIIEALNDYLEETEGASRPQQQMAHGRLLQIWRTVLTPSQQSRLHPLLPAPPATAPAGPDPLLVSPHEEPLAGLIDSIVPDRIIVGFHDQIPARISLSDQSAQAELLRRFDRQNAALYALPEGSDTLGWIRALRQTDAFAYVEPDQFGSISGEVDDPRRSEQWNLDELSAEEAWDLSTGTGVVVAVIDTGITDGGNDGINGLLEGYDYFNDNSDTSDDVWHGTHVAGTIAQNTNNGIGVAGLAWNAEIMPIKVTDEDANTTTSIVVDGINHAIDHGVDVINMSAGFREYNALLECAAADAYNSGIFFAAAVGNDSSSVMDVPAANAGVVAVSSVGPSHQLSTVANWGSELDLVAPGEDIVQEVFIYRPGYAANGFFQYSPMTGTSMAAPHVAAAAALLMSVGATNEDAEQYLIATALDLGDADRDDTFGHGLIQPYEALQAYLSDQRREACDEAGAAAQRAYEHFALATAFADVALSSAPDASASQAAWVMPQARNYAAYSYAFALYASAMDMDLYGPLVSDNNLYGLYVGGYGRYYAGQSHTVHGNAYSAWTEALAGLAVAELTSVMVDAESCATGDE